MDVPVKHAYIKGCLVLGGYIPAEKPLLNLLGICISVTGERWIGISIIFISMLRPVLLYQFIENIQ